jgi:dTDP-4-dehydrorhamnose 3,5-epimerase-like enzyme
MKTVDECKIMHLTQKGDERGSLVIAEASREIPFPIQRVFYIYGAGRNTIRGQHANMKSSMVMVSLKGSCKVKCVDRNSKAAVFDLATPVDALFTPPSIWKEMYEFSDDCVLAVLSDKHYDASEYMRNFDEFVGRHW